jgi:hypothetical protein
MKERSPAFQFYPRQFAADDHVMALDLDAVGAHILLMCAAAASPENYRIPADERAIRNRLRNPSEENWQRLKAQLLAGPWKLSSDGKWWEQDGLQRTFEKQKQFSARQRERAEFRWTPNYAEPMPERCQADADGSSNDLPQECSSSSSSSSNKTVVSVEQNPRKTATNGVVLDDSALRLAELLAKRILQNNPWARITDTQRRQWAVTADRMMRLDERTEHDIASLIDWSQNDDFWCRNILSMDKLRTKFDQLTMHRSRGLRPPSNIECEEGDEKPARPKWTGLSDQISPEEHTK